MVAVEPQLRSTPGPTILRESLVQRLRHRHDLVAEAVMGALVGASRAMGSLPEKEADRRDDVVHFALHRAHVFWPDQVPAPPEDLEVYEQLAADVARHGVPLNELLNGFELGGSIMLADYWSQASAGDHAELAVLTSWHGREMPRALNRVRTAFCTAARAEGFGRQAPRVLAHALATGSVTAELARAAGHRLAPGYLVLVFGAGGCHPSQRQIQAALPLELLVHEEPAKAPVAFLGVRATDQRGWAEAEQLADQLVRRLNAALPGHVPVAVVRSKVGPELTAAVQRARRTAHLAGAVSATGLVRPEALLVEATIAKDPELCTDLAAIARPLTARPELVETLSLLYELNLDRGRSATRLGIHRRTLAYRLDRVQALTGFDPLSSAGIKVLQLALAAVQLSRPHTP